MKPTQLIDADHIRLMAQAALDGLAAELEQRGEPNGANALRDDGSRNVVMEFLTPPLGLAEIVALTAMRAGDAAAFALVAVWARTVGQQAISSLMILKTAQEAGDGSTPLLLGGLILIAVARAARAIAEQAEGVLG